MTFKIRGLLQLWPIPITILVVIALLSYFNKPGNSDSYNVVLGVTLGVVMGFLVDLSKRTLDQFHSEARLRRTARKLLEQDAKSIYRTFELYKGLIASKDQPNAPPGVENFLPPTLEMRYWGKLTNRDDLLDLASEKPFDKWFKRFWELEKVNELIKSLREKTAEDVDKAKYGVALAISRQIIRDNDHEKLLRLFLTKEEFESYKANWSKEFEN